MKEIVDKSTAQMSQVLRYKQSIAQQTISEKLGMIAKENILVDEMTCGGETPLMHACHSGDIHTVGACLNNNCNPFVENSLKMKAADYAELFPNSYGQDLVSILKEAATQWQASLPAD